MISNDNHVYIKFRHNKYNNNDIISYFLKMGRGEPESGTRWTGRKNGTSRLGRDELARDGVGATSPRPINSTSFGTLQFRESDLGLWRNTKKTMPTL